MTQPAATSAVPDHGGGADRIAAAADRLRHAAETGTACAPVRDLIGRNDLRAAYGVQERLTAARVRSGARVVGRKIGLTSAAVQQQLGVDQPDLGMLFDDMAYADGATVPAGRFLQPRVEAEVAFILGADLGEGDLTLDQVRGAIDHAVAALEICDSRIAAWDISFADTVADNASAGAYVLGTTPVALKGFTPREVEMVMSVTGQDDSTGNGAACLGDPLLAVQWLARQARDLGQPLQAGQVVLSGALGPMRPLTPGAVATAALTGLGTVTLRLSEADTDIDKDSHE